MPGQNCYNGTCTPRGSNHYMIVKCKLQICNCTRRNSKDILILFWIFYNITAAWAVDREFFYILWVAWAPVAFLCGALGLPWVPYRATLGSPWAPLGRPWASFGCPWAPFGCPWDALGPLLTPLSLLGDPGGPFAKKCGPSTAPAHKI